MKKTFGTQIREWRNDARVTLVEVASACDCSIVYISDIERDRRHPPSTEFIKRILTAINKSDCEQEAFVLAAKTRKTVQINIESGSDVVTDALVALARKANDGALNDECAKQILQLLGEKKNDELL